MHGLLPPPTPPLALDAGAGSRSGFWQTCNCLPHPLTPAFRLGLASGGLATPRWASLPMHMFGLVCACAPLDVGVGPALFGGHCAAYQ